MKVPNWVFEDLKNADISDLTLAYLCKISYAPLDTVKQLFPEDIEVKTFEDKASDTQAIAVILPDKIILVFRGTESINDWMLNFKTYLTEFVVETMTTKTSVGRVHTGFLECWGGTLKKRKRNARLLRSRRDGSQKSFDTLENKKQGVYDEIYRGLQGKLTYSIPIQVTGHSLGGAIAHIAAVGLLGEGFRVTKLVTFGSPRVGDRRWRDYVSSLSLTTILIHRYVNCGDIVPGVPFFLIPLRQYRHVGTLYYLSKYHLSNTCRPVLFVNLNFLSLQAERIYNVFDHIRLRAVSLFIFRRWLRMAIAPLDHHNINQYIGYLSFVERESDVDALRDENRKLREELDAAIAQLESYQDNES